MNNKKDINSEIKNLKLERIKMILKDPKIGLKLCAKKTLGSLAIVVPLTIIGGIGAATDSIPFYKDYRVEHEHTRIECDSEGNFSSQSQYEDFSANYRNKVHNSFTYYGKWQKMDDGRYLRQVKKYNVRKKEYADIKKLLENDDVTIEDILGQPIKTFEQISEKISNEELEKDAYFETTLYSDDKNKSVIVRQTVKEDIGDIIVWSLLGSTILLMLGLAIGISIESSEIYNKLSYLGDDYYELSREIEILREEKKKTKRK